MEKIATDFEQSKKLAEILPLDSADMLWGYYYNGKNHCVPNIRPFRDGRNEIPKGYTPAWSLTALLRVLPEKYTELIKEGGMYRVIIKDSYMTCLFDNPVDACVKMILKLKEEELL